GLRSASPRSNPLATLNAAPTPAATKAFVSPTGSVERRRRAAAGTDGSDRMTHPRTIIDVRHCVWPEPERLTQSRLAESQSSPTGRHGVLRRASRRRTHGRPPEVVPYQRVTASATQPDAA